MQFTVCAQCLMWFSNGGTWAIFPKLRVKQTWIQSFGWNCSVITAKWNYVKLQSKKMRDRKRERKTPCELNSYKWSACVMMVMVRRKWYLRQTLIVLCCRCHQLDVTTIYASEICVHKKLSGNANQMVFFVICKCTSRWHLQSYIMYGLKSVHAMHTIWNSVVNAYIRSLLHSLNMYIFE